MFSDSTRAFYLMMLISYQVLSSFIFCMVAKVLA